MELQMTGTNIELTSPVRHYIERKLGKLSRHFPNLIEARVEVAEEKTKSPLQHYLVRVTVNSGGAGFHGEARGEDLFTAVDRVSATMVRQLENYKGKLYQRGRVNSAAENETSVEITGAAPAPEVVKVKRFNIKPMSLIEAADQMELLGHNFYLFYNADTEEVNLLYRRNDGNYGLIEPELG